jgi:hypothetical protein
VNIEDNEREFFLDEQQQCLVGRASLDELVARVVEDRRQCDEILWLVVHEQDIDRRDIDGRRFRRMPSSRWIVCLQSRSIEPR